MSKMMNIAFVTLFAILFVASSYGIVPICSDSGVRAALNSLESGNGGTVDATGCGSITFTASIQLGPVPITLILGTGTYEFVNTTGDGFDLHGAGSRLLGQGPESTVIKTGGGFSGGIVYAGPLAGDEMLFVAGLEVAGLKIDQTNALTNYGLDIRSVRDPSSFHNLSLWNMTGSAIIISTATRVSNAEMPQGLSLRDIYIQTNGTQPLTGNTVVVTGNQIYMGSNVKIICSNAGGTGPCDNPSGYVGLDIQPTADGIGDGRYNTFFSGAIAGYPLCASLTAPIGAAGGAEGNVIGLGNTFENCQIAYEMTGTASLRAEKNWAFGNAFVSTTPNIALLNYARGNFVQEITNGNKGAIQLAVASSNNTVIAQMANPNDVSDSGIGNDVFSTLNSTSFFSANMLIRGMLTKSSQPLPVDPPQRVPQYSFSESARAEAPGVLSTFNGIATLDASGEADVQLPLSLEATNRDFHYVLTPIGAFAPLYVATEVEGNRFRIAGGKPGMRVSWQITGIRQGAYANPVSTVGRTR